MKLLIDLGNTRLKLAALDARSIQPLAHFSHAAPDFESVLSYWLLQFKSTRHLWLASVADQATTRRVEAMIESTGITTHVVRTQASALGVRNGYVRFEQLGVDRWLALLALHASGPVPCLSVSVGSALTCDGLTADGQHLGGLIAPTPEAMRQALSARAPGLSQVPGQVTDLARSTEDGIESGCVLAAVALIERCRTRVCEQLDQDVKLVVSGGGADGLRPWLDAHDYRPQLVLEGLARWIHAHTDGASA